MSKAFVNGVEIDYLAAGSGEAVVFSHGGSSDLRYWLPQLETVATHYRLFTYSRRFHGLSHTESDLNTAEDHVSDLVELIRLIDSGAVHLVGFSTPIALGATFRAPDLVRSLTIIEPNMPWLLGTNPEEEKALAWWRQENARVQTEAGEDSELKAELWFELVNNRGPGTFDQQSHEFRQMWLDNFEVPRAAAASHPLTCAQLATISTPTMVVTGEYGMPYSRRIAQALAACIPISHLLDMPGVTHFVSYQHPNMFNQALLEFLQRGAGRHEREKLT